MLRFLLFVLLFAVVSAWSTELPLSVSVSSLYLSSQEYANCQFLGDDMVLEVAQGDKVLTQYQFCSSYGKASAMVEKDYNGVCYVLLEWSEGHGPNATTDYLSVFALRRDLFEYARTPLSSASGATTRWKYQYSVSTPSTGGLHIVLANTVSNLVTSSGYFGPLESKRFISIGGEDVNVK